ncbi:spore germination protein [Paenibacillus sp. MMO-58]|uniref:spore germination protein n=1 Tax=Paenibacillus sp. MMO-58 TaxID=3081290 RepID=UPI003018C1AB
MRKSRLSRAFGKRTAQINPNIIKQGEQHPLHPNLELNKQQLEGVYSRCSDFHVRYLPIGDSNQAVIYYIDGLANASRIEQTVIEPLTGFSGDTISVGYMAEHLITSASSKLLSTFEEAIKHLSIGEPVLFLNDEPQGLAFGLSSWQTRSIEEPTAESVIRGPREGFTETLRVNTALIRRIIKSPLLKMDSFCIGEYTQTSIIIAYIEGLAAPELISEVKERLGSIQIDGILESGYIEELIEDYPLSPFPQILSTERPDVVSGNLLEGRVVILTEGTPFALIVPITFFSLMQSAEDYYQRFMFSTAIRWLRYFFAAISLLLPSIYVALLTFHQEMVPGSLLFSMATSREAVPFPALVEALLMEITFEALREAGVRLPKQIGAAVSIVGALVIGQAAVQAGLVSAPMVIIVAITGISSFMIPRYITGLPIRLLRFPFILLAGSLGLLGIMSGLIALVIHLCSLKSFNVPYLSGVVKSELRDILIRSPIWMMDARPELIRTANKYRQAQGQMPNPGQGTNDE